MSSTPHGFMPAEWEPHDACWLAYPHRPEEWSGVLERAQEEFLGLCHAIEGERLEILVPDAAVAEHLASQLQRASARLHVFTYGDCWMRDTAPIFLRGGEGLVASCFAFNGWGGKYDMPGDRDVAAFVAERSRTRAVPVPWVLEGGSIDVDGMGTLLTTRQCLLDPSRNPGRDVPTIEAMLRSTLGVSTIVWLDDGLINDHTDGHIDTLARFVAPGVVVCMEPSGDDPNAAALDSIAATLRSSRDAQGRRLEVVRIPSPGALVDPEGDLMPASYCNFYVSNRCVVVPTYGSPWDDEAVERIAALFPGRRTRGVPARAILRGGGAFHCMTQQQPESSP